MRSVRSLHYIYSCTLPWAPGIVPDKVTCEQAQGKLTTGLRRSARRLAGVVDRRRKGRPALICADPALSSPLSASRSIASHHPYTSSTPQGQQSRAKRIASLVRLCPRPATGAGVGDEGVSVTSPSAPRGWRNPSRPTDPSQGHKVDSGHALLSSSLAIFLCPGEQTADDGHLSLAAESS